MEDLVHLEGPGLHTKWTIMDTWYGKCPTSFKCVICDVSRNKCITLYSTIAIFEMLTIKLSYLCQLFSLGCLFL